MKFMNLKRFGATVMAGVMAVSMAVPAFASGQTVIVGTYEDIPIAVTVPEEGTAQINPYGLPVNVTKADSTKVQITDQQITSMPLSIKNQGTVPLDVDASLKVVPKGNMEIATAKDTGKKVKVDLEVASLNDAALKVKTDNDTLNDMLIDKFVADSTWTGAKTLGAPAATASTAATVSAAKSNDGTNTSPLATLGAATVDNDGAITYGAKSIAMFRLKGDMAAAPLSAGGSDDPWTAADGFTATIVFSFKPAAKTTVTVTATGSTSAPATVKGYEGNTITFVVEGATGKTLTGTLTGMDGTAPTVTCTETPASSGKYTVTFTMPADDTTAGMALAITGF